MTATPAETLARAMTPWRLGALEVPHRVVMGSMHTGLELIDDGGVALAAFWRERVEGGAALIVTGGLAVSPEGRGAADYAVLGEQATDARLAFAVAEVHAAGGLVSAQLFHAGRYALLDGLAAAVGSPLQQVAPSAVPWRAARGAVPRALTDDEIWRTIDDFAAAAARAVQIGFDAVEIMASEGYLVNQFCSPLTNLRDDDWGGDAVRRRRFAREVLAAVRRAVAAPAATRVPVAVRVSGDDLMPGSSTPAEVDDLVSELVHGGADAISVGVGWHESRVPTVQASVPHGAWLGYAERIAGVVRASGSGNSEPSGKVAVIASNRMTDLRDVEDVLSVGSIDAVALARPFLADAQIVGRSVRGEFELVNTCIGCNQACIDRSLVGARVSCLVNPRAGHESVVPLTLTERPQGAAPRASASQPVRLAVVGAGPAGLAAAVDAARRGHPVTLFEAAAEAGGQFGLAARIPGKEDYAATPRSALAELRALDVVLRFDETATVDALQGGFDAVVVATGVRPRSIDVPGAELPHVITYEQALRRGVPAGSVAIIGGGGIGVDLAAWLTEPAGEAERAAHFAEHFGVPASTSLAWPNALQRTPPAGGVRPEPRPGGLVTVLRRSGRFGDGIGISSRWVAVGRLKDAGVRMLGGVRYERITLSTLQVVDAEGVPQSIPADTVVVCAGQESNESLSAALTTAGVAFEVVGGAKDARSVDAVRATSEGLAAARRLAP